MDENEITQRLRASGEEPVPGEVRASHLSQMHAASPVVEKPKRFGRLAVAAAAFVGFAVGSTGFAMAGALPDPAQQVAHDVLAVVQVDVENPRNRGQCISSAARTIEDEAAKQAAKQECKDRIKSGRPDHAGQGNGKAKGRPDGAGPPGGHPNDGDPCKGPPPWAGNKMTPAEKDAARAERATTCGRDIDVEADEPEELEVESEELEVESEELEVETETEEPATEAPLTETETETESTETEELQTEATEPTDQVEG